MRWGSSHPGCRLDFPGCPQEGLGEREFRRPECPPLPVAAPFHPDPRYLLFLPHGSLCGAERGVHREPTLTAIHSHLKGTVQAETGRNC